ncbi:hypothetical protein RHMOL_Rhmol01G0239400 [Rhododendron molle]|uniref:Uncharacterized protein n=1 Tax=Rhododendron molle TaxID=49168 RepID=A0ACC0Q4G0_RHOML|nr:hypothetical protein RHMOL_Rhmol01G0239400 [Rhododendron molle]
MFLKLPRFRHGILHCELLPKLEGTTGAGPTAVIVESEEEQEEKEGAGDGDGNDDDEDNIPLNTSLQPMHAQFPLPAADPAAEDIAILDIPDSSKVTRGAKLVQPRAEPIPYLLPEPKSYTVI